MDKNEIFKLLDSIPVDKNEYTILSTCALVVRGIWKTVNDLDLAVTKKGLEEFKKYYDVKPKDEKWYIINDKIECCVDSMDGKRELIDGYYVQEINDYYKYLITNKREKDISKIKIVEEYMKGDLNGRKEL